MQYTENVAFTTSWPQYFLLKKKKNYRYNFFFFFFFFYKNTKLLNLEHTLNIQFDYI